MEEAPKIGMRQPISDVRIGMWKQGRMDGHPYPVDPLSLLIGLNPIVLESVKTSQHFDKQSSAMILLARLECHSAPLEGVVLADPSDQVFATCPTLLPHVRKIIHTMKYIKRVQNQPELQRFIYTCTILHSWFRGPYWGLVRGLSLVPRAFMDIWGIR